MNEKRRVYLTFKGKVIQGFWMDRTSDGFSFGPIGTDLHLTVIAKGGKIGYHITHKGLTGSNGQPDEYPQDAHISTRHMIRRVQNMIAGAVVHYHGNKKCWVITPKRWGKIKSMLIDINKKPETYLPLEYMAPELDETFPRIDLWQRTRIRLLLGIEPRIALMETKRGSLNAIWPVSQNQLISFSKLIKVSRYMADVLGLKDLFKYMDETEEGKRFWTESRSRVRRGLDSHHDHKKRR